MGQCRQLHVKRQVFYFLSAYNGEMNIQWNINGSKCNAHNNSLHLPFDTPIGKLLQKIDSILSLKTPSGLY